MRISREIRHDLIRTLDERQLGDEKRRNHPKRSSSAAGKTSYPPKVAEAMGMQSYNPVLAVAMAPILAIKDFLDSLEVRECHDVFQAARPVW